MIPTPLKLFVKLFGVALFLAVLVVVVFLLWGDSFERWIHVDNLRQAWQPLHGVAWIGASALLMTDILLPIPVTVVLSALGAVYGLALGTLAGTVGLCLAGCLGFGIGRLAGPRLLNKLASAEEIEAAHRGVDRWGGWAVILSRSMPVLPEVISIMAGLTGMHFSRFFAALLLGSLPVAFLFSYIGLYALEEPGWGLALSILIPAALWGGTGILRAVICGRRG